MFNKFLKWFQNSTELEKAIIISILAGMVIAAALIIEKKEESFSSLYIYPDSYSNYPAGGTTSFTYGVKSYEKEKTSYDLEIFIGSKPVETKRFDINPGEVYEETKTIQIANTKLPERVYLVLKSPFNSYFAHYWLLGPQETPPPAKIPSKTPEPAPVKTPSPALTPAAGTPAFTPAVISVAVDTRRGFIPKEVTIKTGDLVRWINRDRNEKSFTLVSEEGIFSTFIKEEKRFDYMFNASGTYKFYLKEFPDMNGTVIVK